MHAIPTKRLLVYVVTGLVVLIVGTFGLLSVRGGPASSEGAVVIDAGNGVAGAGEATFEAVAVVGEAFAGATLTTTTTEVPKIWVHVAGAVRRPGVYQVTSGARVFEVVLEAGGFTDDADQEAVALAAQVSDGCTVYVRRLGESTVGEVRAPVQSSEGIVGGGGAGSSSGGLPASPVMLNSATSEQLESLPGIGPSLAQQIITYRDTQGPFTSVDQLNDVPGIGPAKLEQLRPLVGI